ncbi:GGDEF-domain containing protein [Rhizobium wenxiniae]|uniref:Diguanylate cyclase (GGDEF)-like protein n=1 Tax=Rhizobium wenxiniae TaxID=1737357 RepID=A0A7X0D331_9HYPH|nr:EAL domain-containing protein [Rhizobium wenxiniae]MBB6166179.1 diguanylate cyclase (GGDEF)-like protein [Rhizobium wenxiniae]GGG21579.1 GGDEF-domain containing protein [Rhizobium wenxiniae]
MSNAQSSWQHSTQATGDWADTIALFDRKFRLVETTADLTDPALREGNLFLWDIYPELDSTAVTSYSESAHKQSLHFSHDLGNGSFRELALHAIGDFYAVVQTYRTGDRAERAALLHQATHDPLTGLPNRRQFASDLSAVLMGIPAESNAVCLMQLDLDDFKPVNDTLGHPAGDKLLQFAAGRIKDCLTDTERAYRLAGDEFAIISTASGHKQRQRELGDALVQAFKQSFTIDGISVFVGLSVGISTAPADGSDPETLMKASDVALYAAKKEGRGRASAFDASMLQIIEQRELLRRSLRIALERDQFSIEYQPIAESDRLIGFEALLRWQHPLLGQIPPAVFIPMAETDGLMSEIGRWVLENACREALNWPSDYIVAVNLSPAEFLVSGLTDRISQVLDSVGLASDRLELEITESVLLERTVNNLDTLNTLSVLGIRIALDDFGTQYSSLSYLKNFPFDTLKIDKYFVSDLETNTKSQAIVRSVITLAHDLGMEVAAEGVETAEQADWLRGLGCDRLQGHAIGKPLPTQAIREFVAGSGFMLKTVTRRPIIPDEYVRM